MLNKKIMMLAIFIVSLLAISAVSASDNTTSDVVSVDETTADVVKETTDEVVSVKNDNQVITEGNNSVGSFADLETEINNVGEGGALNLTKDYKYVDGSTNGILVKKTITIDGKGHTIDGNHLSKIFCISSKNVTLKNINFINARADYHGGAILWEGETGSVTSCSFINCSGSRIYGHCGGMAIYIFKLKNFTISDSVFINNVVNKKYEDTFEDSKGAVFVEHCNYGIFENCIFIHNDAMVGSAICLEYNGLIEFNNCSFINNTISSEGLGTSIYSLDTNINISYSTFSDIVITNNAPIVFGSLSMNHTINIYCTYFFPESYDVPFIYSYDELCNIVKRNATLNSNSIIIKYGDINEFAAVLKFEDSFLTNNTVIFILTKDNVTKIFNCKTNNDGIALLNDELNELNAGIWNVNVIFEGNNNYNPCNATTTITVLPHYTSLIIEDINAAVGHKSTLVAKVSSDKTVNEGIVIFFDNKTIIGASYVTNGIATINFTPLIGGNHKITAEFVSDNYIKSTNSVKITVKKANVKLTAKSKTFKKSVKIKKYTVTLKTNQNKVMKNTKLTLKVNGKTYSAKTNAKGQATFKITKLTKKGKFIATIKYAGSKNYNAKTVKPKITIK